MKSKHYISELKYMNSLPEGKYKNFLRVWLNIGKYIGYFYVYDIVIFIDESILGSLIWILNKFYGGIKK